MAVVGADECEVPREERSAMRPREWSRSRFWLCHFLHNRHERPRIDGSKAIDLEAPLRGPVARWLANDAAQPPVCGARLVVQAARHYHADPAFVQSLRLLVKEQQHH